MKHFIFLLIAIILETIATTALKASDSFSRLIPSLIVVFAYSGAFYFLSLTLKAIPVGVAYAIWSGVGIVLITIAAIFMYRQMPDWAAIVGIGLIVAGVMVINIFSQTSTH